MMNITKITAYKIPILIFALVFLDGCESASECDFVITPGPGAQADFQNALNTIEKGCVELEEGTYDFIRTLTMDEKADVTIKGAGRDSTILSFADQISGADGLLITNSKNIVVRDFTIRDAVGDALKFREADGIVMYRVGAEWSGEPSAKNGAYGLYPVQSSNILIEECYAYGASDAGIYVGQSDKAIVRNSRAEGNVAGIEIENTTNADVHNNVASDNTAGILVFDLPGLTQSGARTRVFDNTVTKNVRGNFAPGGSIVSQVPAGTGILVLSTAEVEVFNNTIEENNVAGTAVASYAALVELNLVAKPTDPNYDPFPRKIYIHDNTYSRSNTYPAPENQSEFGNLLVKSFGDTPIPDIILDGLLLPDSGSSGSICLQDNKGSSFVNLNLPNDFPKNLSFDVSPHNCRMDPLLPVEVEVPEL
ncbi:right-handed parallel beta-helix repeat-containing protein [Aliifodinibius sp. S!AR15-10]|uniref:parallel beta-helix domain-containing protein n=1 Tax=Aliifodinibius sp. S!AR15-10 TaxID=2950437 RepID=UPI0028623B15|nr:parallel beta-helix domain-containing protein [Aliifodinibius sp. S!AR15-10]MDR8394202.1 right-handed parallel beta-helix repeat-containing protein [Aliifodinibius sp. S!AR15-10]